MKALENIRQAIEALSSEVKRRRAQREAQELDGRDAYHFDLREDELAAEEEPVEREAIEITDAALSYRQTHGSHRRANLVARLRDPGTLRDVIVLNEVLQKPLALRRR